MSYTISSHGDHEAVTAYIDGRTFVAGSDHPNYDRIVEALRSGNENEAPDLFDLAQAAATRFERLTDRVTVADSQVYFDGDLVDNSLSRQIVQFINDDLDFMPLVRFMDNLAQNPNKDSRNMLFDWLRDRHFTITNDGCFIGYKGLNSDGRSRHAGPGIVNGVSVNGRLDNSDGNLVEIARSLVTHDPSVGCASGLHVGTWEYASGWGPLVKSVKVNPRDVISVPHDCDAQKMRVTRYEVLETVERQDERSLYDDVDDAATAFDVGDEDHVVQTHWVNSDSQYGYQYEVREYASGNLECECPAFLYSGDHLEDRWCKHCERI